jgi:HSP20 family molecular chaperone IbpA
VAENEENTGKQDETTSDSAPASEPSRTSSTVHDLAGKAKTWASSVVGAASGFVSQVVGARPWVPATDILVTPTELIVFADLPGAEPATLRTSATAKTVTISGTVTKMDLPQEGEWVQRGRNLGPFEKVIELPREIRAGEIAATLKRGVLELRAPLAVQGPVTTTDVKVDSSDQE